MYIKIKGKEEYFKFHRLLSSYGETLSDNDPEWINKKYNGQSDIYLKCPSSDGWPIWVLNSSKPLGESETLQSLVEHLDNKTELKPLDWNNIIVRTTSTAEQNIFYEFLKWDDNSDNNSFTSFYKLVGNSTDGSIYNYIIEQDGKVINGGFDFKPAALLSGKQIISFEEFQLRKNIK